MTLVDNEMTLADIWSSPECTHASIISQNPPLKVEVWYNLVEEGSMKTWKKTRGMLACAALAMVCATRGVETKCLDGMWEFAFAEGKSLAEAKADFKATDMMPVPGCYDLVYSVAEKDICRRFCNCLAIPDSPRGGARRR